VRARFRRGGRDRRRPGLIRLIGGRNRGTPCARRGSLVHRLLVHPRGSVNGRRRPVGSAVERRHHRM